MGVGSKYYEGLHKEWRDVSSLLVWSVGYNPQGQERNCEGNLIIAENAQASIPNINLRMVASIIFCEKVHGFRIRRGTYITIGETKIRI